MSHMRTGSALIRLGHSPDLAVRAHGWPLLAPFALEANTLDWVADLPDSGAAKVRMSWHPGGSTVSVNVLGDGSTSSADRTFIRNRVKWMFRAGEDLTEFWQLCRTDPILRLCAQSRAGVLLRSATIFEDVVKTLCTTNCHWRNTKRMVAMLCNALGKPWRDPSSGTPVYTFPSVEAVAGATPAKLSRSGLGYRSSYLREFAASVLDGRVPLDEWTRINDTQELHSRIMEIRGIGPYGANHIAMLLSRYDFVPCDSEVCAYLGFPPRTNPKMIQRAIEKRYGRWGRFAFLAFKFERHFRNCNYVDCD